MESAPIFHESDEFHDTGGNVWRATYDNAYVLKCIQGPRTGAVREWPGVIPPHVLDPLNDATVTVQQEPSRDTGYPGAPDEFDLAYGYDSDEAAFWRGLRVPDFPGLWDD